MTKMRLALLPATLTLGLLAAGCGGGGSTTAAGPAHHHRAAPRTHVAAAPAGPLTLAYRRLYALPAPLRDPASAAIGGLRFVLVGGLTAADTSAAEIDVADLSGLVGSGTLASPQHDAQAAALAGGAYVFGGGNFTQYDHILRVDPATRAVAPVGALPTLASDVAVTASGTSAYIVGGFDGSAALDTIVAWRPGHPSRVVGHLPVALRYAAVSPISSGILIIGGSTPTGASRAIFSFDAATGRTREIGQLPAAITHAGAATLGAYVYLVGGRGDLDNQQTAAVWAIDPHTGRVTPSGRLPEPLSDTGVLRIGKAIVVVGGLTRSGAVASGVGELTAAP